MTGIGGKSNIGEGGEDSALSAPLRCGCRGNSPYSDIRGTAATRHGLLSDNADRLGRFRVTPAYLRSGRSLEIKVAQGPSPAKAASFPAPEGGPPTSLLRNSKPVWP